MAKFEAHLKCSFCGKAQDQVRKLIAGPGVYICDECIDLCNEILDEELIDNPIIKEMSRNKVVKQKPSHQQVLNLHQPWLRYQNPLKLKSF